MRFLDSWLHGAARPPDIGSVRCILIFHVSNRTIRCILDRSGGCWEDSVWTCLSPAGWLGQRLNVQLFSHEIYAANRLFCAHSAGIGSKIWEYMAFQAKTDNLTSKVLGKNINNLHSKKINFICWPPYSSEGGFERVSASWVHPCNFFHQKNKY